MAAVIRDSNTAVHGRLAVGHDQVGKTLCRLPDRKAVHPVQTDAEHTAQTRRTEGQRREKAALHLFPILLDSFQLRTLFFGKSGIFQPTLIFRHKIHWDHLILLFNCAGSSARYLYKLYNIYLSMQGLLREFVKCLAYIWKII